MSKNNSKPFWKYVKSRKQDNIGVAPLKKQGQLANDSKEKAQILLDQFASVFTKGTSTTLPEIKTKVRISIQEITITTRGVEKLLQNINPSKASGPDNIPNRVLKQCATHLAPSMSLIFQLSLDTGTLTEDWRNANISIIFKKGDRHAAENYRPVSLTSVPCK